VGLRLVRAAAAGESPAELMQEATTEFRDLVRRLVGVTGEQSANGTRAADTPDMDAGEGEGSLKVDETPSARTLRELGAELLRRSADLRFDEDGHPAYARILQELAPDEARILRLLVLEGPQPSIDVRTGGPLGVIKSDLIAPGLTMIGQEAGCLHPERIAPYLNNLYRLGLIWFSREQLDDIQRYQVLEAQPDVAEAMNEAGRAKTVRRSIHLTPFGENFCETCLPLDTAEIDALTD
jgi:Abortive infection alpha